MEVAKQIKSLTMKRGHLKAQLTRFASFLDNFDNGRILELITRLEKIEIIWSQFNNVQDEIDSLNDDLEEVDTQERETFEELFFGVVTKAKRLINDNHYQTNVENNGTLSPQNNTTCKIKLPSLTLPKFRGQYDQWPAFFDAFESLVDKNESLSNTQKFMYLNSCLEGEAAAVTDSLAVTDSNYTIAWELLRGRYENKRAIVNSHINFIIDYPTISKESHTSLRKLVDGVTKHTRALENLGLSVEQWGVLLINIVTRKLDNNTKREWERLNKPHILPDFKSFLYFLNNRCQVLEATDFKNSLSLNTNPHDSRQSKYGENKSLSHVSTQDSSIRCHFCKGSHPIYICKDFLKLPVKSRIYEAKRLKLCINCLKNDHFVVNCTSRCCKSCNKKHHSLLHIQSVVSNTTESSSGDTAKVVQQSQLDSNQGSTSRDSLVTTHCTFNKDRYILLSTALVQIEGKNGKNLTCRALIDSGSQSNFISSRAVKALGLPVSKVNWPVTGINQISTNICNKTDARLKSRHNAYVKDLSFLVLDCITQNIPAVGFDLSSLNIPRTIVLADPEFHLSSSVDILLGAEIFFEIMCVGQIKLGRNLPMLQKTQFGWLVSGPISTNLVRNNISLVCNLSFEEKIDSTLQDFWKIEDCSINSGLTPEELICENHFSEHTRRTDCGRFVVSLPLRENSKTLGDSLELATNRFLNLERKLSANPIMQQAYVSFMNEYETLGHMSQIEDKVVQGERNIKRNSVYYLPHHGVVKTTSLTTKLRVVFDASAQTSSGVSLNDILLVGPSIQEDLFSIILRFRKHEFVIIADIEKMYRQVLVSDENRDLQRILWRSSQSETIKHYRLNTVTYGTAPASFLAVRCLHELAFLHKSEFPLASQTILSDFYMDDLITGTNTLENAQQLRRDIDHILKDGGFTLRKWMSNDHRILDDLKHNVELPQFYITDDSSIKTLGLWWNVDSDNFQFVINVDLDQKVTKRTILSTIAQIFDPLGIVGPIIVIAKIMLQELWKLQVTWDETVPVHIFTEFSRFREQISLLSEFKFSRQVVLSGAVNIEMHGFCDSSEVAYGACIYIKSTDSSGKVSIRLLCSKSRVAPLKKVTLPRLELCAAVLLARLAHKVTRSLKIEFDSIHLWSDSTIVLAWITSQSTTWKTFVANRVAEVQRLTFGVDWRHVRSKDNPADIISRGLQPSELLHCEIWWVGPSWLMGSSLTWPTLPDLAVADMSEAKPQTCFLSLVDQSIFERYSSLVKLNRVVAYCLRFKNNANSSRSTRRTGSLSTEELSQALIVLIRIVQSFSFASELSSLKKANKVIPSSRLSSLNPFLDVDGLIRVGGRLSNSRVNYDRKYPVVLPHDHMFTRLIILSEHLRLLHAGPQATLASIRTKYWPLRGRSTVKRIIRECVACFKAKPVSQDPFMADLPYYRVNAIRPFYNTGIDFAGPFQIKDGKLRNRKIIKCYVCIFVCLTVKAVHIEVVSDLTTESFLNALKRFASRRGICKHIFSDNATNFHGADNEFKRMMSKIEQEPSMSQYLNSNFITWHFSPARSPHFGGIWEAAVKAAKFHARKIVGKSVLTFEQLSTIFTQIEAILNSRPITPLSSDPSDFLALTPSHFLIGDILTSIPTDISITTTDQLAAYKTLQQMYSHFWKRWRNEYLSILQQRNKWRSKHPSSIKPGMMVLVKDENTPPLCWPLGRITDLHPGKDDIVRVVSVRMSGGGEVKRAVNKICVLPVPISENSDNEGFKVKAT